MRDLEDSLSNENVVPLALPKLPSAFDTSAPLQIVPNGLVRGGGDSNRSADRNTTDSHKGSIEEEKLLIDSTITEKNPEATSTARTNEAKNTTTDSITMQSITSWSAVAGESMAHDSDLELTSKPTSEVLQFSYSDEATMNNSNCSLGGAVAEAPLQRNDNSVVTLNDVTLEFSCEMKPETIAEMENYENKFNGEPLLEDETSPSISLLTSSSQHNGSKGEEPAKKNASESVEDEAQEQVNIKNNEAVTEANGGNSVNPGTPSHSNSHSNSLSEHGRDFLIDDEIEDQPGLFSNYNGR